MSQRLRCFQSLLPIAAITLLSQINGDAPKSLVHHLSQNGYGPCNPLTGLLAKGFRLKTRLEINLHLRCHMQAVLPACRSICRCSMERAIGFRQGLYSVELTALPDHTAPRHSFLLGRAALSAASVGLDSVPCPGGNEVEDRIVYVSLESEGNWK